MSRRLLIMTEIIAPYRIPLFNALAQHEGLDLLVIFLAETDPGLRQWQVCKEEIRFSYEILPSWRRRIGGYNALFNLGVSHALSKASPDVILCGGYNYVASWESLLWARRNSIPFFLWSESNSQDLRRGHVLIEFLKTEFLSRCSGFVVPGRSAKEYLRAHGIREDSIFTARNAVDNDRFTSAASAARLHAVQLRVELGLPARYFLFVGRLVHEKGVFDLLAAYAKLDAGIRQQFGLVFVGDGPSRETLEQQASSVSPGVVRFVGFHQQSRLPAHYALAEALILPTHTDTWGLVVNEAMACSLPVIVSRAAGCAADLVCDGWNGYVVPPKAVDLLSSAMRTLMDHPELHAVMGAHSSDRVAEYSPEKWSMGVAKMMEAAGSE